MYPQEEGLGTPQEEGTPNTQDFEQEEGGSEEPLIEIDGQQIPASKVKEALEYPDRYRNLQGEYTRASQQLNQLREWEPFIGRYQSDPKLQQYLGNYFQGGQRQETGDGRSADDEYLDPEVSRLKQTFDQRLQAIERGLQHQSELGLRSEYDKALTALENKAKDYDLPPNFIAETFIPTAQARGIYDPQHLPILFDSLVFQKATEKAKKSGVQLGIEKRGRRESMELPPSGGGQMPGGGGGKPLTGMTMEDAFKKMNDDIRSGRI
jgi:hypothetical protein